MTFPKVDCGADLEYKYKILLSDTDVIKKQNAELLIENLILAKKMCLLQDQRNYFIKAKHEEHIKRGIWTSEYDVPAIISGNDSIISRKILEYEESIRQIPLTEKQLGRAFKTLKVKDLKSESK